MFQTFPKIFPNVPKYPSPELKTLLSIGSLPIEANLESFLYIGFVYLNLGSLGIDDLAS